MKIEIYIPNLKMQVKIEAPLLSEAAYIASEFFKKISNGARKVETYERLKLA